MAGLNINKKGFIYNTHESAERPYYVSALIKECTKPRESISINNLAILVHQKLRREMFFPIPERACPYIIQTAIELRVLEKDVYNEGIVNRWGARGYVLNEISPQIPSGLPDDLRLLEKDRLAFLKYYLDADGLALLYLVNKLNSEGEIKLAELVQGKQVEQMWNSIIKESLLYTKNSKLRSEMQELMKSSRFLTGNPRATGKTLEHIRKQRVTPHLDILVDLGILERSPPPMNRTAVAEGLRMKDNRMKKAALTSSERVVYRPKFENNINRVEAFLKEFMNAQTVDRILSTHEGGFFSAAALMYGFSFPRVSLETDFVLIQKEVVKAYESCRDDVYRLAFIDAISDIVCVNLQVFAKKVCEPQDVRSVVEKMHQASEKDVRFHRDNYGVITYLVLSNDYVKTVLS